MRYIFLGARFGRIRDKVYGIVSPYNDMADVRNNPSIVFWGGRGENIQFRTVRSNLWLDDLITKKTNNFFQSVELDEFKKVYPTFEHELEQQLIIVGLRGI